MRASSTKNIPCTIIASAQDGTCIPSTTMLLCCASLTPEPYLRMNPVDAEARGIAEGDYVEAYNDRGHCVCKAKFDMGVRPGMVSSPKGWHRGAYVAGSYQELTCDHLNLLHMNTSFDDTLVEVRKYEGEVR